MKLRLVEIDRLTIVVNDDDLDPCCDCVVQTSRKKALQILFTQKMFFYWQERLQRMYEKGWKRDHGAK